MVVGSMNLTHNSVNLCEEAVCATTECAAVTAFHDHFVWLWKVSTELKVPELETMMRDLDTKRRERSSSKSVTRCLVPHSSKEYEY